MPETKTNGGVGWAAREVIDRARLIVRARDRAALLEIKQKLVRIGTGIGLGRAPRYSRCSPPGFLLAAAAAGLATLMPLWAALLVVGVVLLMIAGLLIGLAQRSIKAGTPPLPRRRSRRRD